MRHSILPEVWAIPPEKCVRISLQRSFGVAFVDERVILLNKQGKQSMRDSSAISRSFVVSFFTQRHPQTKTNITERNDGLIDEAKSRRR